MQQSSKKTPVAGRAILRVSLLLFSLFFVNLLIGKGNVSFHWRLPHLGSLAEFLLLGAASTTLIWSALKREAAEKDVTQTTSKEVRHEGLDG